MIDIALNILFIFIAGTVMSLGSAKFLSILQQSGYQIGGVVSWLKQSKFSCLIRYVAFGLLTTCTMLLFNFCFPQENVHYFSMIVYGISSVLFLYVMFRPTAKVPLKITPRMMRLIVVNTLVCFGVAVGAYYLSITPVTEAAYGLPLHFIILFVLLSHYITYPIEKIIANKYIKDATAEIAKRKEQGLKVIGITGSFGKTTAKNILSELLSAKYKVCKGTASFNTPMGLCRVVNEILTDEDEILIAEMGARRVGDIKQLCDMAKPDIALITAVGSQHLETFGTKENIALTKYELIEGLGGNTAVFNGDDEGAKALYEKCLLDGKVLTGTNGTVTYSDVKFGTFGSRFTVTAGGESAEFSTQLLGTHIPSLISACVAVALECSVTLKECATAARSIAPVQHRLQLIKNGNTYVLDDSFNANTEGALSALKVLGDFDCKKVIITPGLVELGKDEKEANTTFGTQIGKYADAAILIGTRSVQMKAGALESGMEEENIHCVKSLDDAMAVLEHISGEKAVLFENDLTDSYA